MDKNKKSKVKFKPLLKAASSKTTLSDALTMIKQGKSLNEVKQACVAAGIPVPKDEFLLSLKNSSNTKLNAKAPGSGLEEKVDDITLSQNRSRRDLQKEIFLDENTYRKNEISSHFTDSLRSYADKVRDTLKRTGNNTDLIISQRNIADYKRELTIGDEISVKTRYIDHLKYYSYLFRTTRPLMLTKPTLNAELGLGIAKDNLAYTHLLNPGADHTGHHGSFEDLDSTVFTLQPILMLSDAFIRQWALLMGSVEKYSTVIKKYFSTDTLYVPIELTRTKTRGKGKLVQKTYTIPKSSYQPHAIEIYKPLYDHILSLTQSCISEVNINLPDVAMNQGDEIVNAIVLYVRNMIADTYYYDWMTDLFGSVDLINNNISKNIHNYKTASMVDFMLSIGFSMDNAASRTMRHYARIVDTYKRQFIYDPVILQYIRGLKKVHSKDFESKAADYFIDKTKMPNPKYRRSVVTCLAFPFSLDDIRQDYSFTLKSVPNFWRDQVREVTGTSDWKITLRSMFGSVLTYYVTKGLKQEAPKKRTRDIFNYAEFDLLGEDFGEIRSDEYVPFDITEEVQPIQHVPAEGAEAADENDADIKALTAQPLILVPMPPHYGFDLSISHIYGQDSPWQITDWEKATLTVRGLDWLNKSDWSYWFALLHVYGLSGAWLMLHLTVDLNADGVTQAAASTAKYFTLLKFPVRSIQSPKLGGEGHTVVKTSGLYNWIDSIIDKFRTPILPLDSKTSVLNEAMSGFMDKSASTSWLGKEGKPGKLVSLIVSDKNKYTNITSELIINEWFEKNGCFALFDDIVESSYEDPKFESNTVTNRSRTYFNAVKISKKADLVGIFSQSWRHSKALLNSQSSTDTSPAYDLWTQVVQLSFKDTKSAKDSFDKWRTEFANRLIKLFADAYCNKDNIIESVKYLMTTLTRYVGPSYIEKVKDGQTFRKITGYNIYASEYKYSQDSFNKFVDNHRLQAISPDASVDKTHVVWKNIPEAIKVDADKLCMNITKLMVKVVNYEKDPFSA